MKWFTSDWHLFDERHVLPYRGFHTIAEMHDEIVGNLIDSVDPGQDELWVLGDAFYANPEPALALIGGLPFDPILVCGNHDYPWTGRSVRSRAEAREWEAKYLEVFAEVHHDVVELDLTAEWYDSSIPVLASHFPRKGAARHGDEFDPWLHPQGDQWLLHGHTHSRRRASVRDFEVHIGVDAWSFQPVSESEIVALIIDEEDRYFQRTDRADA